MVFYVDVFQIRSYYIQPNDGISSKEWTFNENKSLVGFVINTPGCRIPDLNPFDEGVKKYIEKPTAPKCNNGTPPLFESNTTSIYPLNSSLVFYNITDISELKVLLPGEYSASCFGFNESAEIREEFIKVICTHDNTTVYKDMFSFVPLKESIRNSVVSDKKLNILVVGLDAVSRLNLHRQMPKTVDYLRKLEAVEMLGYNKVGDNTFPNLIPVLTGMFEGELKNNCWPSDKHFFDNCHFVWKDYKKRGYVTVYGEDSSWMGLFNYQRRGFRKQTVDYAYNYFNRISENEIGNSHNMNVNECGGGRLIYRDLLDYIKKFAITMAKNSLPYFGFFWGASLSHDYLNKPRLGDGDYKAFFKTLKDEKLLENTVLVFMSDHGIRWGGIRQTFQGRMEERLPFVMLALPDWYRNQHRRAYNNLKRNTRRLTTPFDLHETLVDLMNPFDLTDDYLEVDYSNRSRGKSFFRQISKERTCEDAGISSHWCTCQQSIEIDKNESIVIDSALFAVDNMNLQLEGYAQCANLSLDAVLNARMMTHGKDINGSNRIRDYILTLERCQVKEYSK
ncbi:hypothetical protein JTB14_035011 [Gonioctena quinquepunctata]|nr:hypothetical protein JTB14_035011 [Gonioctena quinquepunctata]